MAIIQISTAFNIDLEFEIAAFHKRLLAYFIDFGILLLYLYSMKYVLYNELLLHLEANVGLDILLISVPMLLYSLLTELWLNGQTIGKKDHGHPGHQPRRRRTNIWPVPAALDHQIL
ncbi:MAG: RDD family protein [Chitinophagaceae bacterium]|nr:RDD family protein [Chitinophagaceae bacterium]